jgi:hypothetical protein
VVNLEAVVDAMDVPDDWEAFIDPETGEIVTISEDDRSVLGDDDDEEDEVEDMDLPDWQRESIAKIRRVLDSGRALVLPGKFEIHEWDLMRRFSQSVEDPDESAELLEAIRGKGAFRLFRVTTERLGLRARWFEYRDSAVREMARAWLEGHGIAYIEEGVGA